MKRITYLYLIAISFLFTSLDAFSYDIKTHKEITKAAINNSTVLSYLQNNLGILPNNDIFKGPAISRTDPRFETILQYSAVGWMEEGAGSEDEYLTLWMLRLTGLDIRANNHFYNPFWNDISMYPSGSDIATQKGGLYDETVDQLGNLIMSYGAPAPNWAYNGSAEGAQSQFTRDSGNSWSWIKARQYYQLALVNSDPNSRAERFAMLFRSLGQIMHLIQDAAQPEHTRNDAHPESSYRGYEAFVADSYSTILSTPALDYSTVVNSSEPVLDFFDSIPRGGAFSITGSKGLAEFSSYNFLTADTIKENLDSDYNFTGQLDKNSYFTYPILDENRTVIEKGFFDDVLYYYSEPVVDPTGQAPAMSIPLAKRTWHHSLLTLWHYSAYTTRDEKIWRAKADILLPKAVSYSASLINYFFRGQLEVIPTQGGLKVKNINQETMTSYVDSTGATIGSIAVYYDAYDPNDINGKRTLLTDYPLSAPLTSGDEITISFTAPSDNIKQNRYIVVFHGKLGNEEGAVVGKINSEYIYYVSDQNGWRQIFRMDADNGANPTLIYNNSSNLHIGRISVSPDGKTLAFAAGLSPAESNIYLIDLTAGSSAQETLLVRGDAPAWSPDGTKIVFERESGLYLPSQSDVELYTIYPATKIETPLTNVSGPSYSAHPAWSPDGALIAYSRFNSNPQEPDCYNSYVIALINTSGQPQGAVSCSLEAAYTDFYPAWSPDGNEIAFTRQTPNNTYQLYKVNRSTNISTKLADSSGTGKDNMASAWSPDGTQIAIGAKYGGNPDIWLVSPKGGGYLTNLTSANTGIDEFPAYGY